MHSLILLVSVLLVSSVVATTCPKGQVRMNGKCCTHCPAGWMWTWPCKNNGEQIQCFYDCTKDGKSYHDMRTPKRCTTCSVCDPKKHVTVEVECGKTNNRLCVPLPGFECTKWDLEHESCIEADCPKNKYYNPQVNGCCDLCPPGKHESEQCHKNGGDKLVDTVCVDCANNTYSEGWTRSCFQCDTCSDHEHKTLKAPCKPKHNVQCECKEGYTQSEDGDHCVKKKSEDTDDCKGNMEKLKKIQELVAELMRCEEETLARGTTIQDSGCGPTEGPPMTTEEEIYSNPEGFNPEDFFKALKPDGMGRQPEEEDD